MLLQHVLLIGWHWGVAHACSEAVGPLPSAINVEGAPDAIHNTKRQPAANNDAQAAAEHVGASEPCTQEAKEAEPNCNRSRKSLDAGRALQGTPKARQDSCHCTYSCLIKL